MNEQTNGENGHILVASDLVKHFESGARAVRAVDGVSFRVPRGRMLAIRGPSGCGKSTLLNLIGALDTPDDGALRVDGVDVRGLTGGREVAYRRRKVGFVFQQFHLVPHLSALENVLLPMELAGDSGRDAGELAQALLRQVGLPDELHRRHPLQPFLGEIQRARTTERIDVRRFSEGELAEMLGAILGKPAEPDLVSRVHGRSDGNAFYAEELVVVEKSGEPLPPMLGTPFGRRGRKEGD